MKRVTMLAGFVLLATTTPAFAQPTTFAPADGPIGRKCGFNSTTDVTREAGWQTGAINAGPLVVTDPPGAEIELYCSVHVNNNVHSGSYVVRDEADGTGVVVMEPRPLNYQATAADDVSLCTEVWIHWHGHKTMYWVGGNPAVPTDTGHWDDDPNSTCGVALSIEPNDPECSIWKAIDRRVGTNIAEIWQDCEPYGEFPLPI